MSSNYSFLYHCFYFTHEVSIFSQIFNDIKVFFFFFCPASPLFPWNSLFCLLSSCLCWVLTLKSKAPKSWLDQKLCVHMLGLYTGGLHWAKLGDQLVFSLRLSKYHCKYFLWGSILLSPLWQLSLDIGVLDLSSKKGLFSIQTPSVLFWKELSTWRKRRNQQIAWEQVRWGRRTGGN